MPTKTRRFVQAVAGVLLVLLVSAGTWSALRAQSLADVARKEEERRKSMSNPPAKVYTNKDLSPVPSSSTPPPATADADSAKSADGKDAAKDGDGKDKGEKKDQAYWSGRLKALQQQLERDKSFADALQVKINSLTTDFVNRDDPVQKRQLEADRKKAIDELANLKKAVADDTKAIADLQEEARRQGVPPGWLR